MCTKCIVLLNTTFTFCSITFESSNALLINQYAKYHEEVSNYNFTFITSFTLNIFVLTMITIF